MDLAQNPIKNQKQDYLESTNLKRFALFLGVLSLVVALPVSISRGLMANYAMIVIVTTLVLIITRTKIVSLIFGIFIVYTISIVALNVPLVKDAADAFALRWELAARSETKADSENNAEVIGGLLQGRVLGQYTAPLYTNQAIHYGHGIEWAVILERLD